MTPRVEVEERYCAGIVKRLAQGTMIHEVER